MTDAVPALVLAAGVKVAVKVLPTVRVIAESVPPVTMTSPVVPSQEKELPGSSEKVKVMVAIPFAMRVDWSAVIVSVGAIASTLAVCPVKTRLFNSTLALLLFVSVVIMSGLPSPLTSPKANENWDVLPVAKSILD